MKEHFWLAVDRVYIKESIGIFKAPSADKAIEKLATVQGYVDDETLQDFKAHAVAVRLTKEQTKAIFGY